MRNSFVAHSQADREQMLGSMGLNSVEDLLGAIPKNLRLNRPLDLPSAMSEWELDRHMRQLALGNETVLSRISFLGGGLYEHHIPAVVDTLGGRGEYLTSYTPYQPRMSQGSLQVISEYQRAMGQLLGVPIVNGSSYDGSTALADALAMAYRAKTNDRSSFLLSSTLWPHTRLIVETHYRGQKVEISYFGHNNNGQVDLEELEAKFSVKPPIAFAFQTPNQFGVLEDIAAISCLCKKYEIPSILYYHPMLSGIFSPPGEEGIDIICGEAQMLGNPLHGGGASLGFLGCQEPFSSYIPGRLVGSTECGDGSLLYSLIREEREQHVAREDAISNICTNQAHCAIRAMFYLATLGDSGLELIARLNVKHAHDLCARLCDLQGVSRVFNAPFFNEFFINLPVTASALLEVLRGKGIYGGIDGSEWGNPNALLMAVTETKSEGQLEYTLRAIKNALEELSYAA